MKTIEVLFREACVSEDICKLKLMCGIGNLIQHGLIKKYYAYSSDNNLIKTKTLLTNIIKYRIMMLYSDNTKNVKYELIYLYDILYSKSNINK